jgi:hypothetical protein
MVKAVPAGCFGPAGSDSVRPNRTLSDPAGPNGPQEGVLSYFLMSS